MAQAMILRRGGGGSKLIVKTYPTSGNLPSTAKLYDVALITSVTPGTVTVGSSAPASSAEGDVWIDVSRASQLPILIASKPNVYVYPVHAKQYFSGAWTDTIAYTWNGSAWVEWHVYLYLEGDSRTGLGGGWVADYIYGASTFATLQEVMYLAQSGDTGTQFVSCRKASPVLVSNYRYLKAYVYRNSGSEFLRMGLQPGTANESPPTYHVPFTSALPVGSYVRACSTTANSRHAANLPPTGKAISGGKQPMKKC
jgi:hypothetical protein